MKQGNHVPRMRNQDMGGTKETGKEHVQNQRINRKAAN